MKIPLSVIKLAKKVASRSQHKFKLGAVIFKKGDILSFGFNHAHKTHPKSNVPYRKIHAELGALLYLTREQLKGSSIYIHRTKKDGSEGLAKPCQYCAALLEEVGIRDIYFSGNGCTQPEHTNT